MGSNHTSQAYVLFSIYITITGGGGGGEVAQSVEHSTPGDEVLGPTPVVAARSLLVGSLSV